MAKGTIFTGLNNTGATILAGSVVYVSGYDSLSQTSLIGLADNSSDDTMPAVGIVREDILDGESGVIKIGGTAAGFDTLGANINDDVFVGTNGQITFEDPADRSDTALSQQLGTVLISAQAPEGQINLFPIEIKQRPRHSGLPDLTGDDHKQYILSNGSRPFTNPIGGIYPTEKLHLSTKEYVDNRVENRTTEILNQIPNNKTMVSGLWIRNNLAAATTVSMAQPNATTVAYLIVMPFSGSIVGLSVREYNGNTIATGTASFDPTINGVAIGVDNIVMDSGVNNTNAYRTYNIGEYNFNAGDRLGIDITTSADWAGTTFDYNSWMVVSI